MQGDKALMGGLMRGDIDLMGGPNFDRLYQKLKVLLMSRCNLLATIILKLVDLYAFNGHNNAASIQKNRGDKSHHVNVA